MDPVTETQTPHLLGSHHLHPCNDELSLKGISMGLTVNLFGGGLMPFSLINFLTCCCSSLNMEYSIDLGYLLYSKFHINGFNLGLISQLTVLTMKTDWMLVILLLTVWPKYDTITKDICNALLVKHGQH